MGLPTAGVSCSESPYEYLLEGTRYGSPTTRVSTSEIPRICPHTREMHWETPWIKRWMGLRAAGTGRKSNRKPSTSLHIVQAHGPHGPTWEGKAPKSAPTTAITRKALRSDTSVVIRQQEVAHGTPVPRRPAVHSSILHELCQASLHVPNHTVLSKFMTVAYHPIL
jgi:hypothetical protein